MKKEFLEYFQSIGIREPILARIEELTTYFETLLPGIDFTDVGVSEYIDKEGRRIYEHLRFYSKYFTVSVLDFINAPKIWISPPSHFSAISFEIRDYDLKHATEASRLVVNAIYPTSEEVFLVVKGSGINCDHIMELCRKYLLPRLAK